MGRERPLILIIDDDPAICQVLEEFLRFQGYRSQCVPTGEDGLAWIAEGGVGFVFLDWMLPEMSGREVLRRITASGTAVPVVVMTAMGRRELPDTPPGAVGLLYKPFDLDEVVALLARHGPPAGRQDR